MGRLIATAMAAALAFVGSTQGALASQGPLTLGGNLQVQLPDGFSLSTERVSPAHDGGVYYDYEFTATPTQALNALYAFDFFTPPEEAGVLVVLNVAFGPALEGDNVLTTNSPTGSFLVQDPLELPGIVVNAKLFSTFPGYHFPAEVALLDYAPGFALVCNGGTSDCQAVPDPGRLKVSLSYEVAPVPEPNTYALMGLGLVGMGLVSRRRR
ncbi:MAG TPA: PEP-CTERM sorting domain-containing protein [Candidatus Aquabacterium excrementipullorum]|nr:PEP-CTERM sorting domain-containing protein [Candidatus Aquabacterium excrementipullorum]